MLNREHIKKARKIIDFNYQEDLNTFINLNAKKNILNNSSYTR